jgi:bacterioferritin (cytochrome b1)
MSFHPIVKPSEAEEAVGHFERDESRRQGGAMKTKELQEKLCRDMKAWQRIENASVASTGKIIEQTDNPIIRMVMEIIQSDSQTHFRVQQLIADTLEGKAVSLTPEDMASTWDAIQEHINLEKKMVANVREALESIAKKNMVVQEYLLHYLLEDERKHDSLLESLESIKKGMYPYG